MRSTGSEHHKGFGGDDGSAQRFKGKCPGIMLCEVRHEWRIRERYKYEKKKIFHGVTKRHGFMLMLHKAESSKGL